MVNYKCLRCNYSVCHKGHFINHLNRKNICKSILEDISIEDVKIYYKLIQPVFNQEKPAYKNIEPAFNQEKPAYEKYNSKICKYCNKTFTRTYGLTCHLKICKKKKESNILTLNHNEELLNIKKELEELKNFYKNTNHKI